MTMIPGQIVRVTKPGCQSALAICKGTSFPKHRTVLVYVPGIGDAIANVRSIQELVPLCDVCGASEWYWVGSLVLFPDSILCTSCDPPPWMSDATRADVIEEACHACQHKLPDMCAQLRAHGGVDTPWPNLQKVLFGFWLASCFPFTKAST